MSSIDNTSITNAVLDALITADYPVKNAQDITLLYVHHLLMYKYKSFSLYDHNTKQSISNLSHTWLTSPNVVFIRYIAEGIKFVCKFGRKANQTLDFNVRFTLPGAEDSSSKSTSIPSLNIKQYESIKNTAVLNKDELLNNQQDILFKINNTLLPIFQTIIDTQPATNTASDVNTATEVQKVVNTNDNNNNQQTETPLQVAVCYRAPVPVITVPAPMMATAQLPCVSDPLGPNLGANDTQQQKQIIDQITNSHIPNEKQQPIQLNLPQTDPGLILPTDKTNNKTNNIRNEIKVESELEPGFVNQPHHKLISSEHISPQVRKEPPTTNIISNDPGPLSITDKGIVGNGKINDDPFQGGNLMGPGQLRQPSHGGGLSGRGPGLGGIGMQPRYAV
eukprot:UN03044